MRSRCAATAASVARERIGDLEYLVAATPMRCRSRDGILTVPLTLAAAARSRGRSTRSIVACCLRRCCSSSRGAGLGYSMAERIADPVNRLTRATRRIARGDLDARIAATLVRRAAAARRGLQQHGRRPAAAAGELERTNRLEAWAEMARQVAHEIKNPLTPIQLNAEHLRRVHADRGEPLEPRAAGMRRDDPDAGETARQIASEFSSFASSPTAKPAEVDVAELLRRGRGPVPRWARRTHSTSRWTIPPTCPPVYVDRTLIARVADQHRRECASRDARAAER